MKNTLGFNKIACLSSPWKTGKCMGTLIFQKPALHGTFLFECDKCHSKISFYKNDDEVIRWAFEIPLEMIKNGTIKIGN